MNCETKLLERSDLRWKSGALVLLRLEQIVRLIRLEDQKKMNTMDLYNSS